MALKVRTTGATDYGRHIKALVCGEPGSGKTLISSTFPNPLYASAEGGLMSIADKGIPYVDVKDTDTLLELKHMLDWEPEEREEKLGFPVDTVVIDTIDEIQNLLIRERLDSQRKEAMQLQDWGWLGEQMKAIVRGFRNLPLNVVFTCHVKETSDSESGATWFKPMLSGQMGEAMPGYVDLSLVLESKIVTQINEDKQTEQVEVRSLLTQPSRKYPFIKDRSGKLPEQFDVTFEDDYARIHEAIFGDISIDEGTEIEVEVPGALPQPAAKKSAAKKAPVKKATAKKAAARKEAPKAEEKPEPTPAPEKSEGEDGFLGDVEEMIDGKPLKRFQYRVNNELVVSRNKLPDGVLPKKGEYGGTAEGEGEAIFCVDDGVELNQEQAELSRIRFRKIYCSSCFEKHGR